MKAKCAYCYSIAAIQNKKDLCRRREGSRGDRKAHGRSPQRAKSCCHNTKQEDLRRGREGWRGDHKAPPRARRREILLPQYKIAASEGRAKSPGAGVIISGKVSTPFPHMLQSTVDARRFPAEEQERPAYQQPLRVRLPQGSGGQEPLARG